MKALILAAGRGKRLGAISENVNKCMIKFNGRPLISYSLACAAALDLVEQIVIVVGYKADDVIRECGESYAGKQIVYVRQDQQQGLVYAIEQSRPAIGSSDFILMLGDELMVNPCHAKFIEEFVKSGAFAMCGVVEVNDTGLIKKTYAVLQGNDGRVMRLIEKPEHAFNNIMGTGNCIFKNGIFSYIPKTPINQKRGEKELPDLIQCAVDDGRLIKIFPICKAYANINSEQELKDTGSFFSHLS